MHLAQSTQRTLIERLFSSFTKTLDPQPLAEQGIVLNGRDTGSKDCGMYLCSLLGLPAQPQTLAYLHAQKDLQHYFPGAAILYFTDGSDARTFAHAGLYQGNGMVLSKWDDWVFTHGIDRVLPCHGTYVRGVTIPPHVAAQLRRDELFMIDGPY